MVCDLCGKNEATVHLTEQFNDQMRELHLCEMCAHEKGQAALEQFGLSDLLAGLADFGLTPEGRKTAQKVACPQCGMTYEDFRKIGRLGCGHCYQSFERYLSPLLKKIHGSTHHVGRVPTQAAQVPSHDHLEVLRSRLKAAIAAEAFEEAARLRDQIRALEKQHREKQGGSSR